MNVDPSSSHPKFVPLPNMTSPLPYLKVGEKFTVTGTNGTTYLKTDKGVVIVPCHNR